MSYIFEPLLHFVVKKSGSAGGDEGRDLVDILYAGFYFHAGADVDAPWIHSGNGLGHVFGRQSARQQRGCVHRVNQGLRLAQSK